MKPVDISNSIAMMIAQGAAPLSEGQNPATDTQLIDKNGYLTLLENSESLRTFAEQLRSLLPEVITRDADPVAAEVTLPVDQGQETGNSLPQAAEITPVLEAATASMETAVSALREATQLLDQGVTAEQVVASIVGQAQERGGLQTELADRVLPSIGAEELKLGLVQALSGMPAPAVEPALIPGRVSGLPPVTPQQSPEVVLASVMRAMGQLSEKLQQPSTPVTTPQLNSSRSDTASLLVSTAAPASDRVAVTQPVMGEAAMTMTSRVMGEQSGARSTSDRLNQIAEKMKVVSEATPRLAQEVKSLGQQIAPAMRVMAPEGAVSHPVISRVGSEVTATQQGMPLQGLFNLNAESAAIHKGQTLSPPALTMDYNSKGWDQALANRVQWMVGHNLQQASLRISPQQLGPVEISLSVQDDNTAKVNFITHSVAVKEALEMAVPRLREMFSESNLQLVNVDVGQRNAQEQRGLANGFGEQGAEKDDASEQSDTRLTSGTDEHAREGAHPGRLVTELGLVDDYA